MGPLQHDQRSPREQAPRWEPRRRECLLAGCGRQFTPTCARSCYCSEECRTAARRSQQRAAQRRYRCSEKGRACRQEQCRRRRQRQRQQRLRPSARPREGHQSTAPGKKVRCYRPGCPIFFPFSARSPLQRFCSANCRQALRRAQLRERRWRGTCASCPLKMADLCVVPELSS